MALSALRLLLLCLACNVADLQNPDFGEPIESRPANCGQYKLPGCPRDFNPVCGSDMTTYPNECTLCMKIREAAHNIIIVRTGPC
ncbi:serine protease inhibitor Kazal-type 2 [Sorex fumeus]|uniref:serine protease inhibitor Kazal-type 2 n=1 Tax=Sorex fumeus TaxID=62283 RepID=UPI0024AE5DFD|nr:serine protease inhibitor Kazal-type 2 [Sorex fumeus]